MKILRIHFPMEAKNKPWKLRCVLLLRLPPLSTLHVIPHRKRFRLLFFLLVRIFERPRVFRPHLTSFRCVNGLRSHQFRSQVAEVDGNCESRDASGDTVCEPHNPFRPVDGVWCPTDCLSISCSKNPKPS